MDDVVEKKLAYKTWKVQNIFHNAQGILMIHK